MAHSMQFLIQQHAQQRPYKPAFTLADRHFTYQQLSQQIAAMSQALLAQGLEPHEKVATVLPNCVEHLLLIWAVTHIGAVIVPLSPLLQDKAIVDLARDADAKLIVCSNSRLLELEQVAAQYCHTWSLDDLQSSTNRCAGNSHNITPVTKDELFNIVYSSGTTGLPKGIMHSHHVRAMYGYCFATAFRIKQTSVVLHTGALVFNGAFVTMMPCYLQGAHFVLAEAFSADNSLQLIQQHQVTHTMMVPSQLIAILEAPGFCAQKLSSLEVLLVLGAPLPQRYKEQLEDLLPGRFHELYGLTEGFVTILDNPDQKLKPGSVGCPLSGSGMRIVDDQGIDLATGTIGEIVGNGPILSSGYYGNAELTAKTFKNGWLYTGDMGYQDEDGFLYLADRKKDMIISGGVNVYPKDIEEILATHPQVIEGAVIGIASEKWGETPVAVVVARHTNQEAAILAWVNERVAARFQKLSAVHCIDEMPRNVAGKTLKNKLRERYSNSKISPPL